VFNIVQIDSTIKSQQDHLRSLKNQDRKIPDGALPEVKFKVRTSSGSSSPGMRVPSLEQKQYGNWQAAVSHFRAKSTGASVLGAGAEKTRYTFKCLLFE
jgi:hypothetical protein